MKIKRVGWSRGNSDFLSHSHQSHELLYISGGKGYVKFGREMHSVAAGDIIFAPAQMVHTGPGGPGCEVIYIIADHPVPNGLNRPFIIHDNAGQSAGIYFENLYDISCRPDKDVSYKRVEETLCELIFELAFALQSKDNVDPEVEQLCGVILAKFSDPEFNLGAEMAAISRSVTYFRRRFGSEMGMSPCRYLTSVRLSHAKKLIGAKKHSGLTFGEIAYRSGYGDEHYFSRAFKKEFGLTPGEFYRQTI